MFFQLNNTLVFLNLFQFRLLFPKIAKFCSSVCEIFSQPHKYHRYHCMFTIILNTNKTQYNFYYRILIIIVLQTSSIINNKYYSLIGNLFLIKVLPSPPVPESEAGYDALKMVPNRDRSLLPSCFIFIHMTSQ